MMTTAMMKMKMKKMRPAMDKSFAGRKPTAAVASYCRFASAAIVVAVERAPVAILEERCYQATIAIEAVVPRVPVATTTVCQ
jgi:hypothetical protein